MSEHKSQHSSHTSWKIYTQTSEILKALTKACEEAQESIYIEQFLFTPDSSNQKLLEVLIEKAKNGVQVRCIFDSLGSRYLGQSQYLDELQKAGVKVKFFNWMLPYSKHSKTIWYFRNHRRLILIDKKIMFTGGVCFGKRMESWRDTHVRVEGAVVEQGVKTFESTWKKVYKQHTLELGNQTKTGLDGFSYITHAPLPTKRYLYHRLIDAIRQAKSEVLLTTPYFLPDNKLVHSLLKAKKRGVNIKILIPLISDHSVVDLASTTYFYQFLEKGIEIYRYPEMIHAKTAVIDSDWSMIGTLNLDNVSLRYNFECALVSTSSVFTTELREIFMADIKKSMKMDIVSWKQRPLTQRLLGILVWPIRKFL
jgi:cardiolipin synthase